MDSLKEDIVYLQEVIDFAILPNTHFILEDKEIRAIRNLIKGYRELEEENSKIEYIEKEMYCNPNLEDWDTKGRYTIRYHNRVDVIPKSKIKEKIEPVIDSLEKNGFVGYADELRDIISELMEDKQNV